MRVKISYHEIESPIGKLLLAQSEVGLAAVGFGLYDSGNLSSGLRKRYGQDIELVSDKTPLSPVLEWLEQYFRNPALSSPYNGPFDFGGSDFQRKVWKQLLRIPAGKTMTYGEIASTLGHRGAARAVGGACGANPIPLVVPCHRVLARNGIGGFGPGEALKRQILAAEGVEI